MSGFTGAVVTGIGVCLTLLSASCTGEPSTENARIVAGDPAGWAGSAMPARRAEEPYPFVDAINLCIDRPGSIDVTEVTMEHTEGGLRIDAYALRPVGRSVNEPETFTESLWELGFAQGSTTVDTVCPQDLGGPSDEEVDDLTTAPVNRGLTELGIQFNKPTNRTARGAIIRLTYRSGDETYVHRIGFELILCEHANEGVPECAFRDYEWP